MSRRNWRQFVALDVSKLASGSGGSGIGHNVTLRSPQHRLNFGLLQLLLDRRSSRKKRAWPLFPKKLGRQIPFIFCTGYPRDGPANPENFVKIWHVVVNPVGRHFSRALGRHSGRPAFRHSSGQTDTASDFERTWTFICHRPSVRLSSVCLSSVCNVRAPYSGDWNFRQCFYRIWYAGHLLTSR